MKFKNTGRYVVPRDEDYQPGSDNLVLKNYLDITSKEQIESIEKQELQRTELELISLFDKDHRFTAEDICNIHELWLGDIYPFAGKYRTVNMQKDGFPFANAELIAKLMQNFEKEYLAVYTPCQKSKLDELAYALGITHIEFILIHPFREGNGRTARLLADLMAMQAGRPPLNYSAIDQTQTERGFRQYILAIHAGFSGNYEPIQTIFRTILEQSIS